MNHFKKLTFVVAICIAMLACHPKESTKSSTAESIVATALLANPIDGTGNFINTKEFEDVRVLMALSEYYFSDAETSTSSYLAQNKLGLSSELFFFLGYGLLNNSAGIGYSICAKKNSPSLCKREGTVGYGLCTLKNNPANCEEKATLGYGICSSNYPSIRCLPSGSVGYGLCTATKDSGGKFRYGPDKQQCPEKASVGFAMCVADSNSSLAACAPFVDSTVGFGICANQENYSPGSCVKSGTIGYGYCTMGNGPNQGCVATMNLGYGMCMMRHKNISICNQSSN